MRRKKPSPPPRSVPLVSAALVGVLGCGPSQRPVPPQAQDPEPVPSNEVPIDAAAPDAVQEIPRDIPPPRDPPVLPDRIGPGDLSSVAPALVGPFDRGEA
jgi:hypothetical protein